MIVRFLRGVFFAIGPLFLGLPAAAQDGVVWQRLLNGAENGADAGVSIACDSSANVYVAGTMDAFSNADYCIAKYSPSGSLLWLRRYDGPPSGKDEVRAIVVDTNGNVYVTGDSVTGNNLSDIVTLKYDTNGHRLWQAVYDGPSHDVDEAFDMALDPNGGVAITGFVVNPTTTLHDYVTLKYGPVGQLRWARTYDRPEGGEEHADAVAVDSHGAVYVTGTIFTLKYSPTGKKLWVRRYKDATNPDGTGAEFLGIAIDGSENVTITGTVPTVNNGDFATIRYDTNGNKKWQRNYDGPGHGFDMATALVVDGQSNTFITGMSDGGSTTGSDYTTIEYSPTGRRLWVRRFDGGTPDPYISNDIAIDLGLTPEGGVCVTGRSVFYFTEYGSFGYTSTLKYDATGHQQWLRQSDFQFPLLEFPPASGVAVDANGFASIVGTYYSGSASGYNIRTIRYMP